MKRLLVNFAGLGDLVMLVPLLRKNDEIDELDLLTRPYGTNLFEGQPFVAKTFSLTVGLVADTCIGKRRCRRSCLSRHATRVGIY